jgi:hypothetical protein
MAMWVIGYTVQAMSLILFGSNQTTVTHFIVDHVPG